MSDSNPTATFGYLAEKLNGFGLAYLHVIEPRIRGYEDIALNAPAVASKGLRGIFKGPILVAGGFSKETAEQIVAAGDADMVAFGRLFISNPTCQSACEPTRRSMPTTAIPSTAAETRATPTTPS